MSDLPSPQPVPGEPALLVEHEGKTALVIADIHTGIEEEMAREGVLVPIASRERLEHLASVVRNSGADRLVLLGDTKHTVDSISPTERRDVPHLLKSLRRLVRRLELVTGNHDALIRNLIPEDPYIRLRNALVIGDVALVHGHSWAAAELESAPFRYLVMGHLHPVLRIADNSGVTASRPCWLRAPMETSKARDRYPSLLSGAEVIVMPAFNEFCGTVLNGGKGPEVGAAGTARGIAPVFRHNLADMDHAEVHLPDGVRLGPLGRLRDGPARL